MVNKTQGDFYYYNTITPVIALTLIFPDFPELDIGALPLECPVVSDQFFSLKIDVLPNFLESQCTT